jgi:hypothetical protein
MTPSNVVRGTVALCACWLAAVPAVVSGQAWALAIFAPGFGGMLGAMFVRDALFRRVLTTSATLVLLAATAAMLKVQLC